MVAEQAPARESRLDDRRKRATEQLAKGRAVSNGTAHTDLPQLLVPLHARTPMPARTRARSEVGAKGIGSARSIFSARVAAD